MLAALALVAFVVGLVLRLADAGTGHAADPWVWVFAGLALLALHLIVPVTLWRRTP